MIRGALSSILLVVSVTLPGQHAWRLAPQIERNAFTSLEGSIDNKFPISMYLALTWDYCGRNDNYKWNRRIVKGWYEYKKIGKRLPLIGSIDGGYMAEYYLKLFVPENILDTLEGHTCMLEKV